MDLADFWGTGDFRVFTEMTGIDPDYNGYLVSIERSDPQADPVWTDILVNPIGVNDNVLWEGGDMCRKLILFGVTDCGLTAINHVIEIDDVMWNCAVQGESSRTLCLQFGAETTNTIDVSCISVFEALGNFVTESREQGLIRNDGIATSIKSKLMAAGNALDSGKPRTAANILRAAESQIATQSGKTIDAMIAQVLLDRIDLVVEYYLETPQVIGGDRTVDEPRFVGN